MTCVVRAVPEGWVPDNGLRNCKAAFCRCRRRIATGCMANDTIARRVGRAISANGSNCQHRERPQLPRGRRTKSAHKD
jgi:hypothetical protein